MSKKKIATVWLGGCSGCHMSLLDIDERILDVAKLADIVKCPIVDGKEMPEVDIVLVEGSVTSDEHLREILSLWLLLFVDVVSRCIFMATEMVLRNKVEKEKMG